MPHQSLKLIPGVDQNRTPALNEAAISTCNLIRFVPDRQGIGLVQKLGGWTQYSTTPVNSVVRALWAWEDTNSKSWLAAGAEAALNVYLESPAPAPQTITPQTTTANVAVSLSTTAGSSDVYVTAAGSNLDNYDSVQFVTQISIGGLVLFGVYPVSYVSSSQFIVQALDIYGNPKEATSTSTTGSVPSFAFTASSAVVTVTLNDHGYLDGDLFPVLVPLNVGRFTISGNYVVSGATTNTFTIGAPAIATTTPTVGASGTGTVATIQVSSSYNVPVGSTITVAGVVPSGYNGTYTVTGVTTVGSVSSVTYANATTGSQTTAGTLIVVTAKENDGLARYVYYNGVGPLGANTGYGVGGYGVGGYGSGAAPSANSGTPVTTDDWTLDNWGETLLACPLNGAIYEWNPTTNNAVATIINEAPLVNAGIFVAMPQRQVVSWGTTYNGIQDPLQIRWSDVDNYNSWILSPTNQAGGYRIPKGSVIVQCIQGPQQSLIWTDLGVWAMQYVGPPYVYQFSEVGTGCGLIGRKAAASMSGVVYWMGQSQFFRLSGAGVEPIQCPIWDVIFQDLDTDNLDKIRVAPNSRFNEIAWFYPTNSNGGEINAYVKYNISLNQWDYGTLSRTAWINESVLGPPIGAGILPNSSSNYLVQHETSTNAVDANGQPWAMDSNFQTGYFALSDADVKMFVDQVWPDMKWGYFGGAQTTDVDLTFYYTDYAGTTPLQTQTFSLTQATTYVTPRMRGRLVSIKVGTTDVGGFWRLGNIRYRVQIDGKY